MLAILLADHPSCFTRTLRGPLRALFLARLLSFALPRGVVEEDLTAFDTACVGLRGVGRSSDIALDVSGDERRRAVEFQPFVLALRSGRSRNMKRRRTHVDERQFGVDVSDAAICCAVRHKGHPARRRACRGQYDGVCSRAGQSGRGRSGFALRGRGEDLSVDDSRAARVRRRARTCSSFFSNLLNLPRRRTAQLANKSQLSPESPPDGARGERQRQLPAQIARTCSAG